MLIFCIEKIRFNPYLVSGFKTAIGSTLPEGQSACSIECGIRHAEIPGYIKKNQECSMNPQSSIMILALIGVAAGLISGIFGLGGGIIIVPALIYLAGYPYLTAVGTSLAILLPPVGLAAVIEYYRKGHIDFRAAAVIAVCLFFTAWVSSHFADRINAVYLRLAFGVFISIVGAYIVYTNVLKLPR
jgi:hypothetical protein